jgi:hypothetical protein
MTRGSRRSSPSAGTTRLGVFSAMVRCVSYHPWFDKPSQAALLKSTPGKRLHSMWSSVLPCRQSACPPRRTLAWARLVPLEAPAYPRTDQGGRQPVQVLPHQHAALDLDRWTGSGGDVAPDGHEHTGDEGSRNDVAAKHRCLPQVARVQAIPASWSTPCVGDLFHSAPPLAISRDCGCS